MAFDWNRDLFVNGAKPKQSLFNVKKLEEGIAKAISDARTSSGHKKKKSFSPSSFGGVGLCSRYWFFAFHGAEFSESPDPLSVFAMEFGNNYGQSLEERLVSAGVAAQRQLSISNDDPPIFGYLDFISNIEDEDVVVDLKTVGAEKFESIRTSMKPPDAHILQVLLYMKVLKYKAGALVYINRDTGKMLTVPLCISEKNKKFIEYVFDWMRETKRWADEEPEPPARSFPPSNWVCKSCPVKETCASMENKKKTGPGKLDIDIINWTPPSG